MTKIDWTDKAIWDALRAIGWSDEARNRDYMRAALDAAVAAQGVTDKFAYSKGALDGALAAIREAAAVAERLAPDLPEVADAIRKLAEKDARGETP